MIQGWYFKEKLDANHSQRSKNKGWKLCKKYIYPFYAFCSAGFCIHQLRPSWGCRPSYSKCSRIWLWSSDLERGMGQVSWCFESPFLWACICKNIFVRSMHFTLQLYCVHVHVSGFVRVLISRKMKTFGINVWLELVHHFWVFYVRQLNYQNLPQLIRFNDVIEDF